MKKNYNFCSYDEEFIEISCYFNEIKDQTSEGISDSIYYDVRTEQLSLIEWKSINFVRIVIQNNQITIIESIDLIDKVIEEKWGIN